MAVMKWKIFTLLTVAVLSVGGWLLFKPNGYSYNHPWVFHDCRLMASICPSHRADWAPPGGGAYDVYGACACAAGVHAVVG